VTHIGKREGAHELTLDEHAEDVVLIAEVLIHGHV
jgi:hypothetical protein